jgi:muramoyltetrapeptide carboxypeptidase LdcA involved in peptidoglycan recycling
MKKILHRPPRLNKGDTIAIITPAAPAPRKFPDRFQHALEQLRKCGFKVIIGACAEKSEGYRSASPRLRANEFNQFVKSPEVKVIMSAIGGWNSNSLLPYLDWDAIRSYPKIYTGFSDVTALLLPIFAKTGLVTFYGPALIPSFGEWPEVPAFTISHFNSLVSKGNFGEFPRPENWTEEMLNWADGSWKMREREFKLNSKWVCLKKGKAEGHFIAGNNNTMLGLLGTPYFPDVTGSIFFIEESFKGLSQIDRALHALKLHGVFDKIAGLVVGKPEALDLEGAPFALHNLLMEATDGFSFPILADVDFGHTAPKLTIPIGIRGFMDAELGIIGTLESAVS